MSTRLARRTGALAAAAAIALGSTSAATAATWSHADAKHYVQVSTNEGDTSTIDATNTATDVTRLRVVHNRSNVVAVVRTRTALPARNYIVDAEVKTHRGRFTVVKANMSGVSLLQVDRGDRKVRCKGLRFSIDRSTASARMTLPRTCIGKPGSVRVGVGVVTIKGKSMWADDASTARVRDEVTLSPWIRRG